jgi:hypothetical protein
VVQKCRHRCAGAGEAVKKKMCRAGAGVVQRWCSGFAWEVVQQRWFAEVQRC